MGVENAGVDTLLPGGLREDLPPIEANAPVPAYYVEATTDSDELVTFYGESVRETFNGATLTQVARSTLDSGRTWGGVVYRCPNGAAPVDLYLGTARSGNGRGAGGEARGTELNGKCGRESDSRVVWRGQRGFVTERGRRGAS